MGWFFPFDGSISWKLRHCSRRRIYTERTRTRKFSLIIAAAQFLQQVEFPRITYGTDVVATFTSAKYKWALMAYSDRAWTRPGPVQYKIMGKSQVAVWKLPCNIMEANFVLVPIPVPWKFCLISRKMSPTVLEYITYGDTTEPLLTAAFIRGHLSSKNFDVWAELII